MTCFFNITHHNSMLCHFYFYLKNKETSFYNSLTGYKVKFSASQIISHFLAAATNMKQYVFCFKNNLTLQSIRYKIWICLWIFSFSWTKISTENAFNFINCIVLFIMISFSSVIPLICNHQSSVKHSSTIHSVHKADVIK